KSKAGMENVEFLRGEIEKIPLPDNSVDVIISNCVINLSADKDRVLREALRVLKPGGRFAVSDVVTRGEVAQEVRQSVLLWVGCVAGALDENEYRTKLKAAGFEQIEIEPTRIYRAEDAREFLSGHSIDVDSLVGREIDDAVGDDYIDGVIGKRDLLDLTPQEFHVLHPRFTLVFVCQRQHLVSHIQAIGFPGRADTFRGQENIYTAARTEIKNHFTGMQIRQRCRIPASERSKQSFLGNLCNLYAVVE